LSPQCLTSTRTGREVMFASLAQPSRRTWPRQSGPVI